MVIDVIFVACSCVRQLEDLLFDPPFPFQRVVNLAKSQWLQERTRLLSIEITLPFRPPTLALHRCILRPLPSVML